MQAAPYPSHTAETATPAPRAQDRFAQPCAPGVSPLHPVTFRGYGAGAQNDPADPERVILCFPVDAGKSVRVSVLHATACEFLASLIEVTGGDRALEQRRESARVALQKRGCRRGAPAPAPKADTRHAKPETQNQKP